MSDLIDRQIAISAICNACGKIDCDKMDKCEKLQLPPANCSEFPNNSDTISRQAAIDAIDEYFERIGKLKRRGLNKGEKAISLDTVGAIKSLPPAQPERIKARWLPIGMADAVGGESAMWGDEIAYHACDNCWQQALEKDGEEILSDFCPHCGAEMEVTT